MNSKKILNCVICKNNHLSEILDLGYQPLANSYIKTGDEHELKFPLSLNLCENCFHVQLSENVNPDLLFKNYLYVSGTSNTLKQYFEYFAKPYISDEVRSVLEIACNDGSLLEVFKKNNIEVLGVDPATNLKNTVEQKGINFINEYWDENIANQINKKFDLIIAMNVLAHVSNPVEFLMNCKKVLSENGRIVVQTSQCNMFNNNEFDTTYHEHISFFSAKSFEKLAEICGLKCCSSYKSNIHGTSYVITFTKNYSDNTLKQMILDEERQNRYELDFYKQFSSHSLLCTKNLFETIQKCKKDYKIIGFGAAAKGNTVLNFVYNTQGEKIKIDYIVDDNELKWDYLTPGTHIPIKNPLCLQDETEKCAFVIFAWNFYEEIKAKIKKLNSNPDNIFIQYFPDIKIEK